MMSIQPSYIYYIYTLYIIYTIKQPEYLYIIIYISICGYTLFLSFSSLYFRKFHLCVFPNLAFSSSVFSGIFFPFVYFRNSLPEFIFSKSVFPEFVFLQFIFLGISQVCISEIDFFFKCIFWKLSITIAYFWNLFAYFRNLSLPKAYFQNFSFTKVQVRNVSCFFIYFGTFFILYFRYLSLWN